MMPETSWVFRAASGAVMTLRTSRSRGGFGDPWFGWASFRPQGHVAWTEADAVGFNVGPQAVAVAGRSLIGAAVRHEQPMGGGTVQIIDGTNPIDGSGVTAAGWIGPWHVAYGNHPYGRPSSAIVAEFSRFEFTDTPEGMIIGGDGWAPLACVATLVVRDLSRIVVEDRATGARNLPPWQGRRVAAGEAWKVDRTEDDHRMQAVLLATPTAVASFLPGDGRSAQDVFDFVQELSEVSWQR